MCYSEVSPEKIKGELERVTENKFPFFCCRLPRVDNHLIGYGVSESPDGIIKPGIIMVPFDNHSGKNLIFGLSGKTNSHLAYQEDDASHILPFFFFPNRDTSKQEHILKVGSLVKKLVGRKESGDWAKTVCARLKEVTTQKSGLEIYLALCGSYPDAFVFYCSSPQSGVWIGASPELLCRVRGSELTTMALAGTRPFGTPGEWDNKNKEEQAIVSQFIVTQLKRYCDNVRQSEVYTRSAGPVEHICTDIKAFLPETESLTVRFKVLGEIVNALSPTPALCGYPRAVAMQDIIETEDFERGFYGGYLAVVKENGDADIYVNLRSMMLDGKRAMIVAGGGIMADSLPEKEWEETERKASTLELVL